MERRDRVTGGDARQVRSRHALHQALLALLEEKPFDQITVREISARAGTGYATFFRHYPTKEALLSVRRLGLKLRSFTLPIPLPTLMLTQAWHPRFDKDPAHRWMRETLKSCCDETWLAAQP